MPGWIVAAGVAISVLALSACQPPSTGTAAGSATSLPNLGAGSPPVTAPPGTTATATGPSTTPASGAGGRLLVLPLACANPSRKGVFPVPPPGTLVTIGDVAQAVGYRVVAAASSSTSATFSGYEFCRYTFDAPSTYAPETVVLVVGSNPADGLTAQEEFDTTERTQNPLSARPCDVAGCGGYGFVSYPGLGEEALKGSNQGQEVLAVRNGDAYVEVGPGTLSPTQIFNLAELIISAVP